MYSSSCPSKYKRPRQMVSRPQDAIFCYPYYDCSITICAKNTLLLLSR